MFKKEKKIITEAPLNYWEEKSYMLAITPNEEDLLTPLLDNLSLIEDVEVKEQRFSIEDGIIYVDLIYQNEDYTVGFYEGKFTFFPNYINKNLYFTNEEIDKLKIAKKSLTIFMDFNQDEKKSFHLQLKIAAATVPNLVGLLDESAEKIFPPNWVKMAASSHVTPGPSDLFTVHAVFDKNGEIWLHTHGLNRCGITELEIVQSDQENYSNHYNLIINYASLLLDKKDSFNPRNSSVFIGILTDKTPLVVTCKSWTEGINEYKNLKLGNLSDRKDGHNGKTSIIFIYKNKEDQQNQKISKVSEYNNLWGDNPIIFISTEETNRMKAMARERFNFVTQEFNQPDTKIIIKIGLPIDNDGNFEHIWFELTDLTKDKFKAKLLQEPYNLKDIHEGYENWYTINDVTDWLIYKKDYTISPSKSYVLMK